MKKYQLLENFGKYKHAGTKAKNDVTEILTKNGYETLYQKIPFESLYIWSREKIRSKNKFLWIIIKFIVCCQIFISINTLKKAFHKIEKNSILFIQFPLHNFYLGRHFIFDFFEKQIKKRECKIHVLIHDLQALRNYKDKIGQSDIDFLSLADSVICHTPAMKKYLLERGIDKNRIKVLYLFDYLNERPALVHSKMDGIAFAGDLKKSLFLRQLSNLGESVKFNLYGTGHEDIQFSKNMIYKGAFLPDELPSKLEGGFGLVWDGDSLGTCTGSLGEYLKYNASHKNSLYIVSRMPIIIWSQAAVVPFVLEKNIGIVVDSLEEIPERIKNISEEEYKKMIQNIEPIAVELEKGFFLKKCLG